MDFNEVRKALEKGGGKTRLFKSIIDVLERLPSADDEKNNYNADLFCVLTDGMVNLR